MPRPPSKPRSPLVEPALARAAFDTLSPSLAAADGPAPTPPADLKAVVTTAVELATVVEDAAVRPRFVALPGDAFDATQLDRLPLLGRALAHCLAEQEAAAEARGEVVLDETLATQAAELRARMLKIVIHYFEDDPELAGDVKSLGRRKTHDATISDLQKLAAIYAAQRTVVEKDPKYWRSTDEADARAAAAAMETALAAAQGEAEQRWSELAARLHAQLAPVLEDVRATGLWLFRKDGAERFGARPAVRRGPGRKRRGEAGEAGEGTTEESEAPAGEPATESASAATPEAAPVATPAAAEPVAAAPAAAPSA